MKNVVAEHAGLADPRDRVDATARAVIESAADAIVAFGTDRTVLLWNPAAERMFGWSATEVIGLKPPIIPEELSAEHNAVLERVRGGGQISFATRRIRKDGSVLDVRIDTSVLTDSGGEMIGWVNICHQTGEDDVARHYMAERARVVRRLGDVVADMNAQRDLESVLDRIAASLRELTGADAGGFVLIEEDRLRLVIHRRACQPGCAGAPPTWSNSLVGELMRSGKTVMMATGESGGFDDLIWSALPGLHTIALGLSHVGGRPYGALYALYSRRNVGHVELELLELLAGHASVALTNAMAFEEVVRQRAHERAVIDASADGIAVLDEQREREAVEPGRAPDHRHAGERGDGRATAVSAARAWRAAHAQADQRAVARRAVHRARRAAASAWSTSVTSPRRRSSRKPRTCSSLPRATNCARPSRWCRDSPPRWPAAGTSYPTPTAVPRSGRSRNARGPWAAWSSSFSSAPGRAPISSRSTTAPSTWPPS